MARSRKEDTKTKAERLQTILRLVQEHPISRQEVLLEHLRNEGFEVTQATVSRDIRELCLVKAAIAMFPAGTKASIPRPKGALRPSSTSLFWRWIMPGTLCW